MIKIKSVNISGIRGIKDLLQLNLNSKSTLIFGENGSGKSSLTDAIEWYYSDGVKHLINEETGSTKGRGALRNLFIPYSEDAFVSIQYTDNKLDAKKTINGSLKTSVTNSTDDFEKYMLASQSENLILRYKDLVDFIISSKTEKLKKLQNIIGFSEVADIRDLLKKSSGRITRNIKSANYDNQENAKQSLVLENLGQNAYTDDQLFSGANELIKPLKLGQNIQSYKDIQATLNLIETKEDSELLEQISFYTKVGDNLTEVIGNVDSIHSGYNDYQLIYKELRKDPENIKKLQLLALLKEGQNVLKNDVVKDDYCPMCQQEKSKVELIGELNERIEELEEVEEKKSNLDDLRQRLDEILQVNYTIVNGLLKEKILQDKKQEMLFEKIQKINASLKSFSDESRKDLISNDSILDLCKIQINKNEIGGHARKAKEMAKELTESKKSNIKFQIYTKLFHAVTAYNQYQSIKRKREILAKQQVTFQLLYTDFIRRQEAALNLFLQIFSADINKYYTSMNPNEKIEDIKLIPIKDRNDDLVGITIEYSFFDETKTPPSAYLSESHINCLGLSFFLASVKAFNKQNKFFILDDVISSFDRQHRLRFAKLITDNFEDYQVLIMTHEQSFFELIVSDIKSKGWLIQDFKWSKETGVDVESATALKRDIIKNKISNNNIDGLGNDIRVYIEWVMKSIAYNIKAQVDFRYNDENEKRMVHELLDAVQSRLKKKGNELKNIANIQKIKGMPMFVANVTSHDNSFNENINDLKAIWEDIEKVIEVFYCDKCKNYISINYYDVVQKKIRCKCGELIYDWKD